MSKTTKMRAPHVGGKRTGNNEAIMSTEKTPRGPRSNGGLPPGYNANADACKSTDKGKK
jgi:hypothetical protein